MFNNKALIREISEKKAALDLFINNKISLFGPTDKESVWNWLENLQLDFSRINFEEANFNVETAYKLNLFSYLDFDQVFLMNQSLLDLNKMLENNAEEENIATGELKEIYEIIWSLDMDAVNKILFYKKMNKLHPKELKKAKSLLRNLLFLSETIRFDLHLLSSLLLYAAPEDCPSAFKDFKVRFLNLSENFNPSEAGSLFRYLGQAFFGNDYEVLNWVFEYYADKNIGLKNYVSQTDRFFDQFVIYLLFKNFLNLEESKKYVVIDNLLLSGLFYHVPVEEVLKDYLSTADLLSEYILNSSALADLLLLSEQNFIFGAKKERLWVGKFISDYLLFAKDRDWLDGVKKDYLANLQKEIGLDDFEYSVLSRLLNIYLHLRECDLLDYRGYLSEEGLREPFDWAKFFNQEVNYSDLEEVKRYFKHINRPIFLKIKIVLSLQTINWREEPFLSRLLSLSDLYESVYGPRYGYLVYFDDDKGEFVLNMDLPDLTTDFINFATGKRINFKDKIISPIQ